LKLSLEDLTGAGTHSLLGDSDAELILAAKLEAAGFNVPAILSSVFSNACDQSSALWHLLLSKQAHFEAPSNPGKLDIDLRIVNHYFEEAKKTPGSSNPLLHIVENSGCREELQYSDPILSPSRSATKKSKKEGMVRPKSAGMQKIPTLKKGFCQEEDECESLASVEDSSSSYKSKVHATIATRPHSVRKKTQHEVDEMSPIDEPMEECSRPLGGSLRISDQMRSQGIQEEDETMSPFQ
jgi:hypothetical protein